MADVPTLLERTSNGHRRNADQDHTYCSLSDAYGVPLTHRLTKFRNESIGCDVEFIVGTEQKVILQYIYVSSKPVLRTGEL